MFVSVFLCMSVIAKQKLWLSLLLSLAVGMLLFNIVPMAAPLDSTAANLFVCAAGVLLSAGMGAVSNAVLQKTSLV